MQNLLTAWLVPRTLDTHSNCTNETDIPQPSSRTQEESLTDVSPALRVITVLKSRLYSADLPQLVPSSIPSQLGIVSVGPDVHLTADAVVPAWYWHVQLHCLQHILHDYTEL